MPSRYQRKSAKSEMETLEGVGAAKPRARKDKGLPKGLAVVSDSVPQVNTKSPRVAEHLASAVVVSSMDYQEAAKMVRPDLTPRASALFASKMARDENVSQAVQKVLATRGLDEGSKQDFVEFLHGGVDVLKTALATNKEPSPALLQIGLKAMQILGKGFIGEKIVEEKPQDLLIAGHEEGIARMLGKQVAKKEIN